MAPGEVQLVDNNQVLRGRRAPAPHPGLIRGCRASALDSGQCGCNATGVERPTIRVSGPTIDAADPLALAEFYSRLLGWPIARLEGPRPGNPPTDGWAMLRSPTGDRKIEVQWEPHYRRPVWPGADGEQLMMMHLDLGVADLDAGVGWARAQGAVLAEHQPQDDVRVMLDPEGHPFCLFYDDTLEISR